MTPFFHVGIVVEDIAAAMVELTATLGLRWRTPHESRYDDWTIKVVYSVDGPPFVELIEGGINGGPWDVSGGARIDHIGYYSEDVVKESERLAAAGLPVEFDPTAYGRRGNFCYHRAVAAGLRIELVNIGRKAQHERRED